MPTQNFSDADKGRKIQDQLTHDTFECIQADYNIRYGSV